MKYRSFLPVLGLATTAVLAATPAAYAAPPSVPTTGASKTTNDEAPTGGLRLIKLDPERRPAPGAAFHLVDSTGKTIADGKTAADGVLTFIGLTPGIARLKETSSGSPLLDTVPDQDVVITPGEPATLQITDPYKPADLTLKATDKATGKGLAGAVVNITLKGEKGSTFTLTTGKDGTAKAPLLVGKKTGTTYTVTQTKVPPGYRPQTAFVEVTAMPGTRVSASFVSTTTVPASQKPSSRPTATTTGRPTPDSAPVIGVSPGTSSPASSLFTAAVGDFTTPPASPAAIHGPTGSLANTGSSSAVPVLLGGGTALLIAGTLVVCVARRRTKGDGSQAASGQHRRTRHT
ncbi:SpaA isopeptide-forming pilin-related protein [Streptomyces sp. S1]|uniref:SpaA isopeptide-forming pilin-related protein n=1 Tax=Streptomyces sp. S1 TaxID=718288 RepID=UPI003D72F34A